MMRAAAVLVLALVAGPAAAQRAPAMPAPPAPARDSLAALVLRGDSAWTREDHARAFAAYDAVVRADSAFSTKALFRVGVLHAWANRFAAAIAAQRLYVRLEPADLEGRVALARTFAWASRFEASLAQYDSVLARDAAYRDAVLGKAQALAWSERIPDGEAILEAWLTAHDTDAAAWTLLGQFRRWRGDARAASAALERAVALAPADAEARAQLAWVRVELAPAVGWTVVGARDSEDNTLWHRELTVSTALRRNLRAGVAARLREASVTDVGALVVPGATVFLAGQPFRRAVSLRAELGAVDYPAAGPATRGRTGWRGAVRAGGTPTRRLRLSGGIGREPFDEVLATAQRQMMFTVGDVDAAFALAPRWQLGVAGSVGSTEGVGPVEITRQTLLTALRFTPRRGVQVALSHREAAWDEPAYGVFFAPQRWATTELSLAGERTADLGLILAGDVGVASQLVGFEASPLDHAIVPRATMRVGFRAAPGREVTLGLTYANVAGAGAITASDYRYGAATIGGRWTF